MKFSLLKKDEKTNARAGLLETSHGTIETPIFMPVGTVGSVKGVLHQTLEQDIKAQIILANTYHVFLRPGTEILKQAGGIHKFMSWDRPVLTDSGGYQVFSLAERRKIKAEGVYFQSHIDGSKHLFTPENVVDTQRIIGSDIMMALDECTPYPCNYDYAKNSLEITHQWLKRGWKHFSETEPLYGNEQAYFPIIQGSVFSDLRKKSAEEVLQYNSLGVAIGGLSVGEPTEMMYEMIEHIIPILPETKPRYLMGVGTPANIIEGISRGIDMFDCVMPTRNGRNGMLFTSEGIINIKNEKWKNDFTSIDPNSEINIDNRYSKAYLRHLFVSDEMLGPIIASIHNLNFYLWLVKEARKNILEDRFDSWKNIILNKIGRRL
ncbi:MAG TPA: tRNA guanosine(34) transglycosylase Tgt [Bacteroidales bacterium]|nr:tRNA guanosine(34) transglycosylase Tgt [Bacteroidales bacterium]HNV96152.1 tRNA guanosine(34) transglycosylase Tgt [Bacteroidales bacterium]